jgi:hypothetical protein
LTGAAKYPAGARPSKCTIIVQGSGYRLSKVYNLGDLDEKAQRKYAKGIEVFVPGTTVDKNKILSEKRRRAWEQIISSGLKIDDWFLDEVSRDWAKTQSEGKGEGRYIMLEFPNARRGTYLLLQLPDGNEWAYFTSIVDGSLGENKWIAAFLTERDLVPWLDASQTPRKFQRVRLFFLDEQPLTEQLEKIEERSRPVPFMWSPPEVELEQQQSEDEEFDDEPQPDLEDMDSEEPPKASETPGPIKKRWSQMSWQTLEKALEEAREVSPVRKKKKKKVPFCLSLKDAYHLGMGGNLVPLQQMLIWGQKPLSLTGTQSPETEIDETKHRSERFRRAKTSLARWMSSEAYKKLRQIKQQVKEGIPYFEDLPTLTPLQIEEIKVPRTFSLPVTIEYWEDPGIKADRLLLGEEWEERFAWDYSARKVAVTWKSIRQNAGSDPRKLIQFWDQAMEFDPNAQQLYEEHGEEVAPLVSQAHKDEWDRRIRKNLPRFRISDPSVDLKYACLNFYNEDIDDDERERRWKTSDRKVSNRAIMYCCALATAPTQDNWHNEEDSYQFFPEEWRQAINENWEARSEALSNLLDWTLERRRQTFKSFHEERKTACLKQLQLELSMLSDWAQDFQGWSTAVIKRRQREVAQWFKEREDKLEALTNPIREKGDHRQDELSLEMARARNREAPRTEIEDLQRQMLENRAQAIAGLEAATKLWEKENDRMEYYREMIPKALAWVPRFRSEWRSIQKQFSSEWRSLQALQEGSFKKPIMRSQKV